MSNGVAAVFVWSWLLCSPADCLCIYQGAPPDSVTDRKWPAQWSEADRRRAKNEYSHAVARCDAIARRYSVPRRKTK